MTASKFDQRFGDEYDGRLMRDFVGNIEEQLSRNLEISNINDLQEELDAKRAQGKTAFWIPASQFEVSGITDPAGGTTLTFISPIVIPRKQFATGVVNNAQYLWKPPKSWNNGTVTARFYFYISSTSTNTVRFGLQGFAVSSGDALGGSFGTGVTVATAGTGTSNNLVISAETAAITLAGTPAAGDLIPLQVYRDGANDTFGGNAFLVGVELFYTTDKENDA